MALESTHILKTVRFGVSPWGLLSAVGALVTGSTLMGFLGYSWWFFDLFAHFRLQYFLTLLVTSVAFAAGRHWRRSSFLALVATLNLLTIAPLYYSEPSPEMDGASPSKPTYRAMLANVNSLNTQYDATRRVIVDADPDILILLEVTSSLLASLDSLRRSYPHSMTHPREDDSGIALFSKFPLVQPKLLMLSSIDAPSILSDVLLSGHSVTVMGSHPPAPSGALGSRQRNAQLAAMPRVLRESSHPHLVLGDLNITPWSSHFVFLLAEAELRRCSAGKGIHPTWPVHVPLFLIPIDHCLHSTDVRIHDLQTGPNIGSDHYPVIVDFSLT